MTIRFADILSYKNDSLSPESRQDFVVRKRRPVWQTLLFMFSFVFMLSIFLSIYVTDFIVFSQVIFVLLGSLGTYVVYTVQRCRDLVLATEFQNALFSSALGHSNEICLIIKNDSTVAYIDKTLQGMLPDFYKEPRRDIDVLLEQGQVSKEDRKVILSAIERRVRSNIITEL
jgi:hypothetical protein